MSDEGEVTLDVVGHVGLITIRRPAKRNSVR